MGSITIKAGAGFDAPWIVVEAPAEATPEQQVAHQRAYVLAAFGIPADDPDVKDLPLAEIVAQAGYHFQGVWTRSGGNRGRGGGRGGQSRSSSADLGDQQVAKDDPPAEVTHEQAEATVTEQLGAKAIDETEAKAGTKAEADAIVAATKAEADAIVAATKPAEHPHQDVLDEIAGASSTKDLQAIYFAASQAMKDPSVLEALQVRSAELKKAA